MTLPLEDEPVERRTATVTLGDHSFLIKQLTDTQIMHLSRYALILQSDNVARDDKFTAMEKMFKIIHSVVEDPEELEILVDLEETGKVNLSDLVKFSRIFREGEEAPKPAVRRRGRPPKSA